MSTFNTRRPDKLSIHLENLFEWKNLILLFESQSKSEFLNEKCWLEIINTYLFKDSGFWCKYCLRVVSFNFDLKNHYFIRILIIKSIVFVNLFNPELFILTKRIIFLHNNFWRVHLWKQMLFTRIFFQ